MAKKPRKKFNPNKQYDLVAQKCSRDILLVYIGGNDKVCYPFDRKTGKQIPQLDPRLYRSLFEARMDWTYLLVAFLRDQQGNEYHAEMEVGSPMPVMHHQLLDSVAEEHDNLIASCNPLHFVNLGYIAGVGKTSFDPVICRKIYDQMKAYEPLSHWEAEQKQKEKDAHYEPNEPTEAEDVGGPAGSY